MIGPLTKKQITKQKWNIKNRQKKIDWDRKKRPWKYKDIMLEIMYEVPSFNNIDTCIITDDVINKKSKPTYKLLRKSA